MIYFITENHTLEHDVQTIIQVFYPNLHYYVVQQPQQNGITIKSILEQKKAVAVYYENGIQKGISFVEYDNTNLTEKEKKRVIKGSIYKLLKQITNICPQWGFITGVRPAKTINELLDKGYTEQQCLRYFIEGYDVTEQKAKLSLEVAKAERDILSKNKQNDMSLYVGIPFCPTRCLYCSFTSYPLTQYQNKVELYLKALYKELHFLGEYTKSFDLKTVYVGGGTPTSLTAEQMKQLFDTMANCFDFKKKGLEFCVEAGRPDTITKEKLSVMKEYGVNRISINPQTMNQKTLDLIGRKHSVEQIKEVYTIAREIGFDIINMDMILGLPQESVKDVEYSMKEMEKLHPENLTVHTLAVKRASRLKENFDLYTLTNAEELQKMIAIAAEYAQKMDMKPYYMYRQKNMVGNFENVGYCIKGKECIYNVQIMEEKHNVFAAGAGASTKTVDIAQNKVERIFNVKSVEDYITRIDEMIDRKKKGFQI